MQNLKFQSLSIGQNLDLLEVWATLGVLGMGHKPHRQQTPSLPCINQDIQDISMEMDQLIHHLQMEQGPNTHSN